MPAFLKEKDKSYKTTLILAGLIFAFIIVSRAAFNVYRKERASAEVLEDKRLEYAELVGRKEKLESEIEKLATERGVEEEIRTKFGFSKEGEELILILDSSSATTSEDESDGENIFKKFLEIFF